MDQNTREFWEFYNLVRWLFIALDIFLLWFFAYALKQAWKYHPRLTYPKSAAEHRPPMTLQKGYFRAKWGAIVKRFHLGSSEATRISIIEADALVDEALKHMGLQGDHMADRLSQLDPEEVTTLNRVWKAHRLRNDIVHQHGFSFAPEEGQSALNDFEAFLKEIDAI